MLYVLVFFLSLAIEACAVCWSISLNKGLEGWALTTSALNAILANGSLYFAIDDRNLLLPATVGEILGTYLGIRLMKVINKEMNAHSHSRSGD